MFRGRIMLIIWLLYGTMGQPLTFASDVYWTDKDEAKIKRGRAGYGDPGEPLLTSADGLADPRGIALDVAGGWMYFADNDTNSIRRVGLDLPEMQNVVTGLSFPADVALDLRADKLYWADRDRGEIRRANLDGTGSEPVRTGITQPYYLALDPSQGKVYWSDFNSPTIHRANMDGTGGVEDLNFLAGLNRVRDLAIDPAAGMIYWCDRNSSKIQRANLDGTGGIEDIYTSTDGLDRPHGLVLDEGHGKMYWTDTATHKVMYGSMDGTDPASPQDQGSSVSGPWGIDLNILKVNYPAQIDSEFTGDLHVLDGAPGAPDTVVELADPAWVNGYVEVFGQSTLNVRGGGILRDVIAWDTSQVNIISGERLVYDDDIMARDSSTVTISGGQISGGARAYDNATLNLQGGSISDWLRATDSSTVNISGGGVFDNLYVEGSSVLNVFAGNLAEGINALGNSQVNIWGGAIDSLDAGMEFNDDISLITINGSGFNYPYGEISDPNGTLTGILANGDPINAPFRIYGDASIVLVPEPSSMALLGMATIALLGLARRRKFRSRPRD